MFGAPETKTRCPLVTPPSARRVAAAGSILGGGRFAQSGGLGPEDLGAALQVAGEHLELEIVVPGDGLLLGGAERIMEGRQTRQSRLHRLDKDAAAIGRVGNPANVPGLLEAVDHPRRRARREAGQLGQPPDCQPAFLDQDVQALDVAAGKPEAVGNRLAEERGLGGNTATGAHDRRDRARPWKHRLTSVVCPGYSLRCAEIAIAQQRSRRNTGCIGNSTAPKDKQWISQASQFDIAAAGLRPGRSSRGGVGHERRARSSRRHGLRRTFEGKGGNVEAVAGVDLCVDAGAIFGFLGPNGAGKTTTLRILTTLLPPTAGRARVAGFDVARQPREVRERIGYVAQSGGSYREATGREELIIQGRLFGMSKADAGRRAVEILEALDLTDAADRTCKTYSGGMRRRLNIGIGMVHRPAMLFLDEPTTGLDPQARARLWDEIRRLRDGWDLDLPDDALPRRG